MKSKAEQKLELYVARLEVKRKAAWDKYAQACTRKNAAKRRLHDLCLARRKKEQAGTRKRYGWDKWALRDKEWVLVNGTLHFLKNHSFSSGKYVLACGISTRQISRESGPFSKCLRCLRALDGLRPHLKRELIEGNKPTTLLAGDSFGVER